MNYGLLLLFTVTLYTLIMRVAPGQIHAITTSRANGHVALRSIDPTDGAVHSRSLPITNINGSGVSTFPFVWDDALHFVYYGHMYVRVYRVYETGIVHLFDFIISGHSICHNHGYIPMDTSRGTMHQMLDVDAYGRLCFILTTMYDGKYIMWINMHRNSAHIDDLCVGRVDPSIIHAGSLSRTIYDRARDVHYMISYQSSNTMACEVVGEYTGVKHVTISYDVAAFSIIATDYTRITCCDGIIMLELDISIGIICANIDYGSATLIGPEEWSTDWYGPVTCITDSLSVRVSSHAAPRLCWRDARTGDKYVMNLTAIGAAFDSRDDWKQVWLADGPRATPSTKNEL